MLIFVDFWNKRIKVSFPNEIKVKDVKEFLRKKFDIRLNNEGTIPIDLLYEGATLYDAWTLNGIGMMSGETIKAIEKPSRTIVLSVYSAFNNKVYQIYEKIDFTTTPIYVLRRIVSQLSGLPVSIFRLVTRSNMELFDKFTLSRYHEVGPGGVIRLDIWNGWSNLLNCAINGETRRFTNCLSKVEKLAQFQARVGLYIAAHRGHSQLSERLTTKKSPTAVSPGDGVGVHPARLWCDTSHPDTNKAPVHIAAECGHLHVLRIFFSNDVTCITAGDGTSSDAKAWNYALRYKQKECARYLLAKCFAKVPVGKGSGDQGQISITIAIKMRQWLHRAKRRLQERQRYNKGPAGVISKSLSELSMSGIAVGMDTPAD